MIYCFLLLTCYCCTLQLRNYEEVIQLCEQSLDSAKRNSFLAGSDDQLENLDSSGYTKSSLVGLWRWHLISKSYFYLGKLEEAIELLKKHEQAKPIGERYCLMHNLSLLWFMSIKVYSFFLDISFLLQMKTSRCGDKSAETSASFFVTVCELLRLKVSLFISSMITGYAS